MNSNVWIFVSEIGTCIIGIIAVNLTKSWVLFGVFIGLMAFVIPTIVYWLSPWLARAGRIAKDKRNSE